MVLLVLCVRFVLVSGVSRVLGLCVGDWCSCGDGFGRCCLLVTMVCCLWTCLGVAFGCGFVIIGLTLIALCYYLLFMLFTGFAVLVLFMVSG